MGHRDWERLISPVKVDRTNNPPPSPAGIQLDDDGLRKLILDHALVAILDDQRILVVFKDIQYYRTLKQAMRERHQNKSRVIELSRGNLTVNALLLPEKFIEPSAFDNSPPEQIIQRGANLTTSANALAVKMGITTPVVADNIVYQPISPEAETRQNLAVSAIKAMGVVVRVGGKNDRFFFRDENVFAAVYDVLLKTNGLEIEEGNHPSQPLKAMTRYGPLFHAAVSVPVCHKLGQANLPELRLGNHGKSVEKPNVLITASEQFGYIARRKDSAAYLKPPPPPSNPEKVAAAVEMIKKYGAVGLSVSAKGNVSCHAYVLSHSMGREIRENLGEANIGHNPFNGAPNFVSEYENRGRQTSMITLEPTFFFPTVLHDSFPVSRVLNQGCEIPRQQEAAVMVAHFANIYGDMPDDPERLKEATDTVKAHGAVVITGTNTASVFFPSYETGIVFFNIVSGYLPKHIRKDRSGSITGLGEIPLSHETLFEVLITRVFADELLLSLNENRVVDQGFEVAPSERIREVMAHFRKYRASYPDSGGRGGR